VIRFSAGLVVVALGVLIGGVVTSKLSLVYVSIAVSVLALIAWAIGVFLKRGELREELFGGRPELVPASAGVGAGSPAPERPASAPQSPAPSPATAVAAAADRPAYGQDGYNAAAFSPPAQVRSTLARREAENRATETSQDQDRSITPAGRWGSTSAPPSATPPVAPRAWDGAKDAKQPFTPPVPDGIGAPSADAGSSDAGSSDAGSSDAGSSGALRSWFDRPATRAKPPAATAAEPVAVTAAEPVARTAALPVATTAAEPVATTGAMPADEDPAAKPGDTVSTPDPVAADEKAADDDEDWPTRYSWLDDEQADEAVESDDVPLVSDDAVAAEVEASDLPEPPSAGAPEPTAAQADAEQAAAEHADAEKAEAAEAAVSPAPSATFEGTDAADEAPVLPSVTDHDRSEAAQTAEAAAEAESPAAAEPSGATQGSGTKMVTVVPGVPRYHEPDCILIRFMPEKDVQTKSIPEAQAAKCTPCAACQPED